METTTRTEAEYRAAVARVVRYVQSALDEVLTPRQLANVAGFSPHHFHRVFRAVVGESVMDFVRRLRLERAAYRLKTPWSARSPSRTATVRRRRSPACSKSITACRPATFVRLLSRTASPARPASTTTRRASPHSGSSPTRPPSSKTDSARSTERIPCRSKANRWPRSSPTSPRSSSPRSIPRPL